MKTKTALRIHLVPVRMPNIKTPKQITQLKNWMQGAGEMAQWLRALSALPKVLSSIPGNHMVAHNHL